MNIYEIALDKACVIIGIQRNSNRYYFCGTRNKKIVELTNGNAALLNNFEKNNENYIEFYDLKNDKVEKIDLKNGEFFEFTIPGLPFEISPPMFLNPKWENEQNNNTVIELQQSVFDIIKTKKNLPAFKSNLVNENKINGCLNFLNNTKELDISLQNNFDADDKLFYFKLTCDGDYTSNFYNEYSQYHELLHLKPVFSKLGFEFDSTAKLQSIIANENVAVKQKWVEYLNMKKVEKLVQLEADFNKAKENITDSNILNVATFQFNEIQNNIKNQNYTDILKNINDARLFLRYSPEYLDNGDLFSSVAPFDNYDFSTLNNLITNNIVSTQEHNKEIFEYGIASFCSNHLEEIRQKRKEQILTKRTEVLQKLTESEKSELSIFLTEDVLLNKLDVLTNYYDILIFWPPVLMPRPDFVLPS
jgi:hypothetical protein